MTNQVEIWKEQEPIGYIALAINKEGKVSSRKFDGCNTNEQRGAIADQLEQLAKEYRVSG